MPNLGIILAVVHEASALGSDGESLEVSPCTSDQMSTSSCYPSTANGTEEPRYIPNVKMRQKPARKWSEVSSIDLSTRNNAVDS